MHQKMFSSICACLLAMVILLTACEISSRPTEICHAWNNPAIYPEYPPENFWGFRSYTIIDDLRPNITWTLEDGAECVPARYDVQVWSVNNYLPGASAGWMIMAGSTEVEVFPWPADGPSLSPGHSYTVYVKPYAWDYADEELVEVGGAAWEFTVGPVCDDSVSLSAPRLHWPPDNWAVDPGMNIIFEWTNELGCWPANGYSIEVSATSDFSELIYEWSSIQLENWVIHPMMEVPWENCEEYYWRVRPEISDSISGPYSDTWSFTIRPGDVICPLELGPIITPIPPVSVTIMVEANCRSGPTMDYPLLSVLPAGGQYEIEGTNQEGDSWLIYDPTIANMCWVFGDLVEVLGDTSLVMIIDPTPPGLVAAPTETETPVDCSQWSGDYQSCIANPACEWQPNLYPNDPCRNK